MPKRSSSNLGKVYKFVHRRDEYIVTNITGISYKQKDGWFEIEHDGTIHICGSNEQGYAWDGCTPKFELLDLVYGTPDGRLDYFTQKPITYYASMVHDIIYQFKSEMHLSRKSADILFYKILKEAGFFWCWLYYPAVRIMGAFFGKWKSSGTPRDIRIIKCSWIDRAYEEMKELEEEVNTQQQIQQIEKHPFFKKGKSYSNNQNS